MITIISLATMWKERKSNSNINTVAGARGWEKGRGINQNVFLTCWKESKVSIDAI